MVRCFLVRSEELRGSYASDYESSKSNAKHTSFRKEGDHRLRWWRILNASPRAFVET